MVARTLGGRIGVTLFWNGNQALRGIERTQRSILSLKRVIMTAIAGKVVKDMAQFGRSFSLMADRTGMSVQKLSGLRNAFVSAGSGARGFERTINNINDSLQGLALGNGEGAARLAMFNVSPYTSSGRMKEPDEILYGLADWARKQKGKLSKEQILYRFRTLLNIDDELGRKLLDGAESFRKFRENASERMGEIDDDTKNKLDNLKTQWDELGGTVTNTTSKIVADLDAPLSTMLDWSRELVKTAGEYPKVTAMVTGFAAMTTVFVGIGKVIAGVTGALFGLKAALVVAIGAILGFIGKLLVGRLVEDLTDKFGSSYKKMRDSIKDYIGDRGVLKTEKLRKDFASGVISKEKNALQYYTALSFLKNANPERYQADWERESRENFVEMKKLGFNPYQPTAERLFQDFPTNIEQANVGDNKQMMTSVDNSTKNYFYGDVTPEVYHEATGEADGLGAAGKHGIS